MTSPIMKIIAAGSEFDRHTSDVVDRLAIALAELHQWARSIAVEPSSHLAFVLERTRPLVSERDHDDRQRCLRYQVILEDLPEKSLVALDHLIDEAPRRRALTTQDCPFEYLEAQVADGWFALRAYGLAKTSKDLGTLLDSPTGMDIRFWFEEAQAEAVAKTVSYLFHGGANPENADRFYVRHWASPVPQPEPIVTDIWFLIDRTTNAKVLDTADAATAEALAGLFNRQIETATLYAQASYLFLRMISQTGEHEDSAVLSQAAHRIRTMQRDILTIMKNLDALPVRI